MSKPLPTQLTFANLSPPWSLPNLDGNFANVFAAINDYGTYNLTLTDTGSVNALAVTPAAGLTLTLSTGLTVIVAAANTSTSTAPTLNANGTGAKTILDSVGNIMPAGGIQSGGRYIFVYDGTNWRCLNPTTATVVLITKPATTSRTSTVTMTNDPDLQIALVAGTWLWEMGLLWNAAAAGATPGSRAAPSYSGTVTTGGFALSGDANAVPISGAANVGAAAFSAPFLNSVVASPSIDFMLWSGFVQVSTSGTLSLIWAQQNSSGSALSLLAASYLKVTGLF